MAKKKEPPKTKKKPTPPPKRKGIAMWLGLIFFVSMWMFILGIFVGRGTAPVQFDIEKLQKELAALKAEFVKKEQDRLYNQGDQAGKKTELRFYEVLKKPHRDDKLDTEIVNRPKTGTLPGTVDTHEVKTMVPRAPETTGATPQNKADVAEKKPEIIKDTERQEAAKPQVVQTIETSRKSPAGATEKVSGTGTHLTIQVASFKDPKVADAMVEDLVRKGYPAYRIIGDVRGKGTWFRVRIGTFKNRDEAGATLARLKKDGLKAILVRR